MRRPPPPARGRIDVPPTFIAFCTWIGVELTAAQAVLCRLAYDGERLEALDDAGRELAGRIFGALGPVPRSALAVVAAVCGARGGKSYVLVALRLVWGALVRDLSTLAPGQRAVALVIGPNDKLRQEVINYALGAMRSKPELRTMLVLPRGTTDDDVVSSFGIRRPDGHIVTFEGGVATRGGYGGRGRSLTDAALDETAFFRDAAYKVNDEEIFKAVTPRVLPGGQTLVTSTPWAETGLLYDLWKRNHGHPVDALVAHAPTILMRPSAADIVERETLRDPDNAEREYGAKFMSAGSLQFFDGGSIDAAIDDTLADGRTAQPGDVVAAGLDMGLRSDSSALVIVHRGGRTLTVADVLELRPEEGQALKPSETVKKFAARMRACGASYAMGDQHYRESVVEYLAEEGLAFADAPGVPADAYVRARTLLRDGRVKLPRNERLLRQLREVQARPTSGGGLSISHPRWRAGGHGDICQALVLALYQLGGDEVKAPEAEMGTAAWEDAQRAERRKAALAAQEREWWKGRSTRVAPGAGLDGRVARAEARFRRR
jgi:hypothetical protein